MKKHIIYLITDTNRTHIEVFYGQDLVVHLSDARSFFNKRSGSKFNRIVHIEEFASSELAQARLLELSHFTHMQKQRLIRKYNPNWLNVGSVLNSYLTPHLVQIRVQ